MVARLLTYILLIAVTSACSVYKTAEVSKIVLLAPFEGQYREIGYDALYSARLALSEQNLSGIDLLALDDGGVAELAQGRIEAINQDPSVIAIIALGQYATSASAQSTLIDTPMIVVGHWGYSDNNENVYNLSHPDIDSYMNFTGNLDDLDPNLGNIIGGEMLSLYQTPLLYDYTNTLDIYSSASLPTEDFRQRYLDSADFTPEPNLLSTLSYDATNLILNAITTNTPISEIEYEGINGLISFDNGYWLDAPIRLYRYQDTRLVEILD